MNTAFKTIVLGASLALSSLSFSAAQVDYVKNGITVWKVDVPNTNVVGFKAQSILNYPINRVAAALTDVDHSAEWLPRIGQIKTLKVDDVQNYADMRMVIDMPFPLTDRELFLTSKVTRKPNGDLWVSNDLMNNAPKANPDFVRITEYSGGWKLEQVDAKRTRVTLTGHADPAGGCCVAQTAARTAPAAKIERSVAR